MSINWLIYLTQGSFSKASLTLFYDGCIYMSVLRGVECPNKLWRIRISTSLSFMWLENECLNVCGVTLKYTLIPDAATIFLKLSSMVRMATGFPFFEINRLDSVSLFAKYCLTDNQSEMMPAISAVICKVRRFLPLPITVSFLAFTSMSLRCKRCTSPIRSPRLYLNTYIQ
jgi:hypothetical protein